MAEVMLAWADGAEVEYQTRNTKEKQRWWPADHPFWEWDENDYRIKPKLDVMEIYWDLAETIAPRSTTSDMLKAFWNKAVESGQKV